MSWIRAAYVLSLFSVAALVAQIANIITVEESIDQDPHSVRNVKMPTLLNNDDNEVFVFLQVLFFYLSKFMVYYFMATWHNNN